MKKEIIITTIIMINIMIANAQKSQGIRFEKTTDWVKILEKAKAEHKYIFVDCFATWCGPCREMDSKTYSQKEVGDVYNQQFVCVKWQMDRTPLDNDDIKFGYGKAWVFIQQYAITAYPTYLFFDPDGKPVHKDIGFKEPNTFIQLAADAQNPAKQYYKIVKNYQPAKLDTVEEKALARQFTVSDKEFAGKIAVDYLTRIPENQLSLYDNGRLMTQLQDIPQVLDIAMNYIRAHDIKDNIDFIFSLRNQPKIKKFVIDYIDKLTINEFGLEKNLLLIERFNKDSEVQKMANTYINRLPEDSLFSSKIIRFLRYFTKTPVDRGFEVFFRHAKKVDYVMKNKDYAQSMVVSLIGIAEFVPLFVSDTTKGVPPDFKTLSITIEKAYNEYYAKRVTTVAKLTWYNYLVKNKKQIQFWSELIEARTNQIEDSGNDTSRSLAASRLKNDFAYTVFLHSGNIKQLNKPIQWMRTILEQNIDTLNYGIFCDTYASLLYKAGRQKEAIASEQNAMQFALLHNDKKNAELFKKTSDKMQKGEQIWLEKDYQ